jgi:hypothetical protein
VPVRKGARPAHRDEKPWPAASIIVAWPGRKNLRQVAVIDVHKGPATKAPANFSRML